jgi:DNA-binding transcriptional regulator YdaS (Cro superfamily)
MVQTPLRKAIDLVGTQAALAREIERITGRKCPQQYISHWLTKAHGRVPAEWVIAVEVATDRKVDRHALRPDIYPPEEARG